MKITLNLFVLDKLIFDFPVTICNQIIIHTRLQLKYLRKNQLNIVVYITTEKMNDVST